MTHTRAEGEAVAQFLHEQREKNAGRYPVQIGGTDVVKLSNHIASLSRQLAEAQRKYEFVVGANDQLLASTFDLNGQLAEAQGENERMRKALQEIAEKDQRDGTYFVDKLWDGTFAKIAKAALAPAPLREDKP